MKRKRFKIWISIFLLLMILILFRANLYNACIDYTASSTLNSLALNDVDLKKDFDERMVSRVNNELFSITKLCLKFTKANLSFTRYSKSVNPDKLYQMHETHCVGYAAFFNSLFNYCIEKKGLKGYYESKHIRGKIFLFGNEITGFSDDSFWNDHDYVEVRDKKNNITHIVDPSLYEFTLIGLMKK